MQDGPRSWDKQANSNENKQSNSAPSKEQERVFTTLYQLLQNQQRKEALDLLTTLSDDDMTFLKENHQDQIDEIMNQNAPVDTNTAPRAATQRRARRARPKWCSVL